MTHPLALKMVELAAEDSTAAIVADAANDALTWEEVSRRAGLQNVRLMNIVEKSDAAADRFIEANADHAFRAGMHMFKTSTPHTDPEFILDLAEGVNVLVSRVRQGAEEGRVLPMNYMDMRVRKLLFLTEQYLAAPDQELEKK
jgi:hypothetical protein